MALVTISGYPCSGKSRRARQIKEDFERRLCLNVQDHGLDASTGSLGESSKSARSSKIKPASSRTVIKEVVIVDDDMAGVERGSYDNSLAEKPARASLFSHVTRLLSPTRIVICDTPNYIKGFRYQMYCAAREAGARVATVFVAAPPAKCLEWHNSRPDTEKYKQATFDNMIMRYEEPSSMVRWDSPLFTISWDDEKLPLDEMWEAITMGNKKAPTGAVIVNAKPPPNSVQLLTTATTAVITALQSALTLNPTSPSFVIPALPPFSRSIRIAAPSGRVPTMSELQRLRRQFETIQRKAIQTNAPSAAGWSEQTVGEGFARYLEETWRDR